MGTPFVSQWACEPEDVAGAVCWPAPDESRLVTATRLSVHQGMAQFYRYRVVSIGPARSDLVEISFDQPN
jgi:hypothetical protein